ncbi:hypothetical protein CCYA_CCYA15G3939 [Cyanidiococcus yangmingshanensis]|nr:hypothetical protein CCYA_CCYA15G3939 [Cyanidiococcus yangmingshanensis]
MMTSQKALSPELSAAEARRLLETIQQILEPHLQSFNYAATDGLRQVLIDIEPLIIERTTSTDSGAIRTERLELWLEDLRLRKPRTTAGRYRRSGGQQLSQNWHDNDGVYQDPATLLPHHCRALMTTYAAQMSVVLCWRASVDNSATIRDDSSTNETERPLTTTYAEEVYRSERQLGEVPVMVGSKVCNLDGLGPDDRLTLHEEEFDCGGYFIVNGIEKVIRMVIMPRANHVMVIARDANARRGEHFSRFCAMVRCARSERARIVTNHLHYLNNGYMRFRFTVKRQEYLLPFGLVMKALYDISDRELFSLLTAPSACCGANLEKNVRFISERAVMAIRELYRLTNGEGTREAALSFIGSRFRCLFGEHITAQASDECCGVFVIRRYVLTHLDEPLQKLEFLAYMARKLMHFMTNCIVEDDPDSLANQEVLLPGQLWLLFLQEKLQDSLLALRDEIQRQLSSKLNHEELSNPDFVRRCIMRARAGMRVGDRMQYMISTGNASLRDGAELLQQSGFSVVADRINFQRFLAHFYCVHRGQYFMSVRSSEFRKLKPEAWGFICPVHTPDGAPCGILNHLSQSCRVVSDYQRAASNRNGLEHLVRTLPIEPSLAHESLRLLPPANSLPVLIDGRVWGYAQSESAIVEMFRRHKLRSLMHAEIVPVRGMRLFPSILLFSTPSRLVRPVWNRLHRCTEWIGTMEQLFLTIDLPQKADEPNTREPSSHCELKATNVFSLLASFIPFSNMNQSPRNIYQCQMGKQAMGVPFHDFGRRFDSKAYRLLTPQQPLVQNQSEYQAGWSKVYGTSFNAVVAVISYTGYDMEDGMVINRSSLDRGFAHGTIYSSERIDLDQMMVEKDATFRSLPSVGDRLEPGSVLYCVSGRKPHIYSSNETSYVDAVVLAENRRRVTIRMRTPRRPVIGDKFASRHGQKGVLSAIWPSEDMPYTANGIVPDILFNPNGFPSRMTIGMMVESIAGKVAAVHGEMPIDATSFEPRTSQDPLHDEFGRLLSAAGYSYYGNETMYSGYTGEPFQVQIFVGIIAWQRLRHHIADKFQVRTEGIIHQTLRQPLRGRKRGGAIRLGEMERDALLASGAAYTLQDRLQNCSDLHTVHVSVLDGSLLSPVASPNERLGGTKEITIQSRTDARSPVVRVHMPYAFKYLVYELAAMNIRVSLHAQ